MLPEPHYLLATKSGKDPSVFPDVLPISRVPGPIAGDNLLYCTIVALYCFPILNPTLQISATCVRHWFLTFFFSFVFALNFQSVVFLFEPCMGSVPRPLPTGKKLTRGVAKRWMKESAHTTRLSYNKKTIESLTSTHVCPNNAATG